MSQKPVSLSPDLSRLRSDGHNVSIGKSGHLLVTDVPYVNANKQVKRGIIACDLDLAGGVTVRPKSHVAFFVGDYPCNIEGAPLPGVSQNTNQPLGDGLTPNHQISRKPTTGPNAGSYVDYHEKIKTYVDILGSPAQQIEPNCTAITHPVVTPEEGESVFHYLDTAATKAGIVQANKKLEGGKIGIVGLGGTGAYVLDLVAKTPVDEIHLYDGDLYLNHNAFRCPGAASLADLEQKQRKVDYFASLYSRMRRGITPHNCFIDASTVEQLKDMSFVFLCIDKGMPKRLIVEQLEQWGTSFIDVGMGIQLGDDNTLGGLVTVTTSTGKKRDHLRRRTAFTDGEADNEYSRNVQIAELNALSATLAVIKWKKLCKYYDDTGKEYFCAYMIRDNRLICEDTHGA